MLPIENNGLSRAPSANSISNDVRYINDSTVRKSNADKLENTSSGEASVYKQFSADVSSGKIESEEKIAPVSQHSKALENLLKGILSHKGGSNAAPASTTSVSTGESNLSTSGKSTIKAFDSSRDPRQKLIGNGSSSLGDSGVGPKDSTKSQIESTTVDDILGLNISNNEKKNKLEAYKFQVQMALSELSASEDYEQGEIIEFQKNSYSKTDANKRKQQ